MLELLGLLTGIGELANAVSFRRSGSSTKKDTAGVTQNALDEACQSKAKLNRLKKEKAETQAKLEEKRVELKQDLEVKKNELNTNQEYSKGVFRDKGNKQKVTESEIKKLEDKLKENKQNLKDHKTNSEKNIKAIEQEHKVHVKEANKAVKSEKNLQETNPLSAHQAAYIGDTELFKQVNKSVALNNEIDSKDTPLHAAILGGNQEIILKLGEERADFGAQNKDGQTPIHLAAKNPNYKSTHRDIDNIIEVIPELSPVLDIPDKNGKTALHYAAERGDSKTVEALIDKGADPNALDNQGKTPVAYVPKNAAGVKRKLNNAVYEYSLRIFEIANIDQRRDERYAKEQEDLDKQNKEIERIEGIIKDAPGLENIAKPKALNAAIAAGDKEKVEAALQSVSDMTEGPERTAALAKYNVADNAGRTPLSYAMEKGLHEKMEVISSPLRDAYKLASDTHIHRKRLCDDGIKIHQEQVATVKGHEEALAEANKESNKGSFEGYGSKKEQIAALEKKLSTEKAKYDSQQATLNNELIRLKEAEKDLADATKAYNPPDKMGRTPLSYAIAGGNADGAALYGHTDLHMKAGGFKTKGKDVQITDTNKDEQNINGETPLHVAAKAGNKEMADALLAKDVKLSLPDIYGKTPLHVATERGNTEVVEALVKKNHNLLQEKGQVNKTPVDIAIEQGNVKLLENIRGIKDSGITEKNINDASEAKLKIEKAKKLEEEKAREEERKRKEQEQLISGKSGLTEEQKAKMAANAPARDAGQQQRSSSTGHAPQDHQGQVWKEENFKNENGVKICTIGDTSQGHFKQTRTADGKFEYEVQNTGNDEPDRIQVLKVPREGSNPKSFDIVKFDREGNVVGYQEGKGGASKIGPETMKKIKAHEESLSKALVSDEKAKPPVNKGSEIDPPDKPQKQKDNLIEDFKKSSSIRDVLEQGSEGYVKSRITAINAATQQRKQSKGASRS